MASHTHVIAWVHDGTGPHNLVPVTCDADRATLAARVIELENQLALCKTDCDRRDGMFLNAGRFGKV